MIYDCLINTEPLKYFPPPPPVSLSAATCECRDIILLIVVVIMLVMTVMIVMIVGIPIIYRAGLRTSEQQSPETCQALHSCAAEPPGHPC